MQLHFKSTGNGPAVVILHGLFGMLDNWQSFSKALGEDHTVYTPDLRNHGRSPHAEAFDYASMAGDIHAFITEHTLGPVTLMGHSLGGKVAMQAALTWPEDIKGLIVVDMAPRAYTPHHDSVIRALEQTDPAEFTSRNAIEDALMTHLGDLSVARFLMKNVGRDDSGNLFWRMNLPVLAAQYENILVPVESDTPYTGPALFVRGGNSSYVRDEDKAGILSLFPKADLKTVEGAGHWVHADDMEGLLALTRAFLSENGL